MQAGISVLDSQCTGSSLSFREYGSIGSRCSALDFLSLASSFSLRSDFRIGSCLSLIQRCSTVLSHEKSIIGIGHIGSACSLRVANRISSRLSCMNFLY
jgi:hypothetical protein